MELELNDEREVLTEMKYNLLSPWDEVVVSHTGQDMSHP